MKRYLVLLVLLFVLIPFAGAIEFSAKEKAVIYTNSIKLLSDYQRVINQIGEAVVTDVGKAGSGSESLLELFVNRQVLVYNDLDPAHKLSEFYEAETYSNNLVLWYPDGISINLDLVNARVSEIHSHDQTVYSVDILVKKSINGNYLNQTLNKNTEELTFRIAFNFEGRLPNKFRIVGIRSSDSNAVIDYSKALKEVTGENFSPGDLVKVHNAVITMLQDYSNFLSLIGDPQEAAEDKTFYKESFLKLFPETETKIYNDIMPDPVTKLIPVTDYLTTYITDYPNGIKNLSINADSAKFGRIMKSDGGNYYLYTDVNKFFSGSYKGKDIFREMFPLIFKIAFTTSDNTFSGFKITGIDISSAFNFYESAPGTTSIGKPEIVIKPVSRKGLSISLAGSFGQTSISDKNIESMSMDKNFHSWNVTPVYGFLSAIGVQYNFTDNIYARSGIELNKYSEKFNLTGTFTDKVTSTDLNGEAYYRIVQADYDSTVNINFITLPLLAGYTSGKPGEFGFYAEGGIKISLPQKTIYKDTGSYQFYASPYSLFIDPKDALMAPELGFYSRNNIDITGNTKFKGLYLSLYASAGANIPLGYFSSVTIGPELNIGISDLKRQEESYKDIFGKSYTHQPVKIRYFGLRVSFVYKL
jgi:opacity protein-like surface antigen